MPIAAAKSDSCVALQGSAIALASDGGATSEIEVILSGDYKVRNLLVNDAAIDSMIANHKAAGVDPAVDREHESWSAPTATPAMGWVKALSKRPSSADPSRNALVATVEWTDVGAAAVAAKHYRYISAGLDLKAKHRLSGKDIGVMLDHVALVKHPFVQGMQPLSLSAAPLNQTEGKNMNVLLKALGLKEDADEATALAALGAKNAEIAALKAQNDSTSARLTALESEAKAANLQRLADKLDAKIAAFAVDPSERSALLELAAAAPETFEKLLALRVSHNPSGPALKVAKAPPSALGLQQKAIADFMAANACDEMTALMECAAINPDLFKEVA